MGGGGGGGGLLLIYILIHCCCCLVLILLTAIVLSCHAMPLLYTLPPMIHRSSLVSRLFFNDAFHFHSLMFRQHVATPFPDTNPISVFHLPINPTSIFHPAFCQLDYPSPITRSTIADLPSPIFHLATNPQSQHHLISHLLPHHLPASFAFSMQSYSHLPFRMPCCSSSNGQLFHPSIFADTTFTYLFSSKHPLFQACSGDQVNN